MRQFVINVFVRDTIEGSAAVVLAHMHAHMNNGSVIVHRYKEGMQSDEDMKNLLAHIREAHILKAPTAKRIEIWDGIGGRREDILDDMKAFGWREGHRTLSFQTIPELVCSLMHLSYFKSLSVMYFAMDVYRHDRELTDLYELLPHDEFEPLIANCLLMYPDKRFHQREDYLVTLFAERAREQ